TPSILGNVFEKYINQKEMGAYYTEQDTTDYITQNSIITALVNKLYHKEKFIKIMVSSLVKNPEKYINLDKSYRYSYEEKYIQTLLFQIKEEIKKDGVKNLEDFIKYNIDMLALVKHVIKHEKRVEYLKDFYRSLKSVSILDPTCGTGAFIINALDIMTELYKVVDIRIYYLTTGRKLEFTAEKEFELLKFCIENNLFGVDLMKESIEILKTRLYLRLLLCFKDREELITFPKIYMNFKSGNSLVGEVKKTKEIDQEQMDNLT